MERPHEHADSADEIAGLGLSTILRRLGLDEVFPVLAKKGVKFLQERAKIDKEFDTPLLQTVRGAGYMLRETA